MKISANSIVTAICLLLPTLIAHAADTRIYQTDRLGNIQSHNPYQTIKH